MLHAGAILDLGRVAAVLGVATAVGEAEIVEFLRAAIGEREDLLDPRAEVVTIREIEAERSLAPPAIISVALAERRKTARLLLAAELPRVHISDEKAAGHMQSVAALPYRRVSERWAFSPFLLRL